jgi:hypothetical protein
MLLHKNGKVTFNTNQAINQLNVLAGKETSSKNVKESLFFKIWIFRNSQLDCDDDRRIFCSDDTNLGAA